MVADTSVFQNYSNCCSQCVHQCFLSFLQTREFDVDNLSKAELRMLLSVMEGELEARDLVIEALRVSYSVIMIWFFAIFEILFCHFLYAVHRILLVEE